MKKSVNSVVITLLIILLGCNSGISDKELIGEWINKEEKSTIQLEPNHTFKSNNLPLDIQNKYYLTFNKSIKEWQGTWTVVSDQLQLKMNESYYYLNLQNITFGKLRLYVKLLDESGGEAIYFDKR